MASFAPERVSAYAFFSVPYMPPRPDKFTEFMEGTRQLAGRELFGYWYFFNEDDIDKTLRAHVRDLLSAAAVL